MNVTPNRTVAIATPLIFAPLAGAVTALAAKYAPGLDIDQGQLQAIFIAGATIALAKSGLWMRGWQLHEQRQELLPSDALDSANEISSVESGDEPQIGDDPDFDDTDVDDVPDTQADFDFDLDDEIDLDDTAGEAEDDDVHAELATTNGTPAGV